MSEEYTVPISPFKLERFFARYEFSARYLLSSSDCESFSVGELLALEPNSREGLEGYWLGYTEAPGLPALRALIAGVYTHISADQVLTHAGAEEGIFAFMHAVLQPGDHIIAHAPGYQSLYTVAESVGCTVSRWEADPANGWALDVDALSRLLRPNTRAVIVNCPHNPTGYLMQAAEQTALVAFCRQHGLLLFSDEVYRELEHNPADRLPAACDLYENAVSLGVLSKTYGLPGLRIGWVASRNAELLRKIAAVKDYLSICNSAPSEYLAMIALRNRGVLAGRNLGIVRANLDLLDAFFARWEGLFTWQRPRAGSTAFPAVHWPGGAESFAIAAVERAGVMILPSTTYDYGDGHFRVGFGRRNLPEALAALEFFLEQAR